MQGIEKAWRGCTYPWNGVDGAHTGGEQAVGGGVLAIEILVATRANRGAAAAGQLKRLAKTFAELGAAIDADLDPARGAALGELILSTLRGMVTAQMIVARPVDTTRDRAILVEVISTYIDRKR